MMRPWEFAPALTSERLIAVADILRRARDSAARHARRKLGDTLCSIGLVAYERSCHALELASIHEFKDWLRIKVLDNHFNIRIGDVPARFYRGDPDLPIPSRTLAIGAAERQEIELALDANAVRLPIQCLRFEVDKNAKGFTREVNFVFVDEHGVRFDSWSIPRFSVANGVRPGAVQLPPIDLDGTDEGEGTAATAKR